MYTIIESSKLNALIAELEETRNEVIETEEKLHKAYIDHDHLLKETCKYLNTYLEIKHNIDLLAPLR